jgi:hypothetical protein
MSCEIRIAPDHRCPAWAQKNSQALQLLLKAVDLALGEFKRNPGLAIKTPAESLGVNEAITTRREKHQSSFDHISSIRSKPLNLPPEKPRS